MWTTIREHMLPGYEYELRISPKLIAAAFVSGGTALAFAGDLQSDLSTRTWMLHLALLCFACAAVTWLTSHWQAWAGRWSAVALLIAVIRLGSTWLEIPELMMLLALPTALAAALIHLRAATAVTIGETVLLLLDTRSVPPDAFPSVTTIALIAVWTTLGVMCAIYVPVYQAVFTSWQHYEQRRQLLEEARKQQVDLKQALEDLAQANIQLTRLNMVTQRLRQVAEDARSAKEQFVANVSHELRTPLNMIVGFCEMILQAPEIYGSNIPIPLLSDLSIVHRNAEHLTELIDDVLDLSQIETGHMALAREQTQFQRIIDAATVAVRPLFDSKHLYLETTVQDDMPYVFCDPTRMREVLLNLLSNAGRFTDSGGVHLDAHIEGDDIVVSISDTGRGIAAEDMDKLFQPFQQLDGSIRRRYAGSGLGLSISKRFIELHGGKIQVESEFGVGTCFTFRLPLTLPTPTDGGYARWLTPSWEYIQRTRPSSAPKAVVRPRIVVLETEDALCRLLTRYMADMDVVPVTTLEKALQELASSPSQALLINSTSMDRVVTQLQSNTFPPDTPVIVCSVPGVHERAETLGISDYLVKPISRTRLLAALDRLEPARTILIVDDEPEALRLFRRMLSSSKQGYRVLRASDGNRALDLMRKHHPDVLLLDLVMPEMNGFQLLEAKKQDPTLNDIPVIAISAQDPAGQPIISKSLMVTREGGLSAQSLLACIKNVSEILSTAG